MFYNILTNIRKIELLIVLRRLVSSSVEYWIELYSAVVTTNKTNTLIVFGNQGQGSVGDLDDARSNPSCRQDGC